MSFAFKKLQVCLTQFITLHVYIPPKIIYSSLYRKNDIKSIKNIEIMRNLPTFTIVNTRIKFNISRMRKRGYTNQQNIIDSYSLFKANMYWFIQRVLRRYSVHPNSQYQDLLLLHHDWKWR